MHSAQEHAHAGGCGGGGGGGQHTGLEGTIAESDKVCYTCYQSHFVILGQKGQSSTDSDLLQLITAISNGNFQ